jgi:hypothetical protein
MSGEFFFQKSARAAKEKNRAASVTMNADVRRTKARLLEEVVKLQKIATKKVVLVVVDTNLEENLDAQTLDFEAKCTRLLMQIRTHECAGERAVAGGEGAAG